MDCEIYAVLNNAVIHLANQMLNKAKLLEKLGSCLQNFRAENVLFAVHPQVRETFLGGVENFCEVTERAFLVENLVGLRKTLSVVSVRTFGLENFTKSFDLAQKLLAGSLPVLGVQVVFLVRPLFQTIGHHHCVL